MKKIKSVLLPTLLLTIPLSIQSHAQEGAPVVELLSCNFNSGQNMDDLMSATSDYNRWSDRHDINDVTSVLMLPTFYSEDISFDFGWLNAYPNASSFGNATQTWIEDGGDILAGFMEVSTCTSSALYGTININMPEAPPPEKGMIMFRNCKLHDGDIVNDAVAGLSQWNEHLQENGFDVFSAVFLNLAGHSSDTDYNFKTVSGFDARTMGQIIDLYTGGSWRLADEIFGGVMACDSPRIYQTEWLRRPEQ